MLTWLLHIYISDTATVQSYFSKQSFECLLQLQISINRWFSLRPVFLITKAPVTSQANK